MKILLAVDSSETSEKAVEAVARQTWPEGSEVRIISVVDLSFFPIPETGDFDQWEQGGRELMQAAVNQAAERIRASQPNPPEISQLVINGHAKQEILDEAERWGADLIVVGSHGYRGLKRFVLGSVSQAIVSHAHCSVMVVR